MDKQIISVKLWSNKNSEFSRRPYSFFCDLDVKVGDLVIAPTQYGDAVGKVNELNVPESRIDERIMPLLRTITEFAPSEVCDD